MNNKDFYSVFKTDPTYKVLNYDKPIGNIPFSPQLQNDENILLAARIWKIIEVDHKTKKISVIPTHDGKKPIFTGSAADLHPKIRERMLQLLQQSNEIPELEETAVEKLRQFRNDFKIYPIESLENDRPVLVKEGTVELFTFQGTKINKTLHFLLGLDLDDFEYHELSSSFVFHCEQSDLADLIQNALSLLDDVDTHVENLVISNPAFMEFSKWATHLPVPLKCKLLAEKYFGFEGTRDFLNRLSFISTTKL